MNFYLKYLKYKKKYLELKNSFNQNGGAASEEIEIGRGFTILNRLEQTLSPDDPYTVTRLLQVRLWYHLKKYDLRILKPQDENLEKIFSEIDLINTIIGLLPLKLKRDVFLHLLEVATVAIKLEYEETSQVALGREDELGKLLLMLMRLVEVKEQVNLQDIKVMDEKLKLTPVGKQLMKSIRQLVDKIFESNTYIEMLEYLKTIVYDNTKGGRTPAQKFYFHIFLRTLLDIIFTYMFNIITGHSIFSVELFLRLEPMKKYLETISALNRELEANNRYLETINIEEITDEKITENRDRLKRSKEPYEIFLKRVDTITTFYMLCESKSYFNQIHSFVKNHPVPVTFFPKMIETSSKGISVLRKLEENVTILKELLASLNGNINTLELLVEELSDALKERKKLQKQLEKMKKKETPSKPDGKPDGKPKTDEKPKYPEDPQDPRRVQEALRNFKREEQARRLERLKVLEALRKAKIQLELMKKYFIYVGSPPQEVGFIIKHIHTIGGKVNPALIIEFNGFHFTAIYKASEFQTFHFTFDDRESDDIKKRIYFDSINVREAETTVRYVNNGMVDGSDLEFVKRNLELLHRSLSAIKRNYIHDVYLKDSIFFN